MADDPILAQSSEAVKLQQQQNQIPNGKEFSGRGSYQHPEERKAPPQAAVQVQSGPQFSKLDSATLS